MAAAAVVAAIAALACPVGPAKAADPRPQAVAAGRGRPAAITVSYDDLLEAGAVTRTGRRLTEAARDPGTPRAHLQPFLESYSSLLPYVTEMVFGADPVPRKDILERWPAGSPQPAWVALFRGGRYRAVADGQGGVSLFLPGNEARAAWRKHYSAVRHCLAALAAASGQPLSIKVFAYRNDYRSRELRLNLQPAAVTEHSFPPDRAPLDLASLEDFFQKGGRLEGAELNREEGLVLYASPDQRDALAGEPVSLADLAVAYRAVFHAGDNDAFISLDPSADPLLASVNFGGYLEDTRLGAAVLAADRLFKTISTGLDPVTFTDMREDIRKRLPAFLTNAERGFLDDRPPSLPEWVSVRSWFYPESISVDADPDEGLAVITRPQFTAAAERTSTFAGSPVPRKKGAVLPAEVRESIRDINVNYSRYAAAFTEIRDLAAVARLMAVSTWLQRSAASWVDLDALLSVELPAGTTPRSLEQMISTEYVIAPPAEQITAATVGSRSGVFWLTPLFRRSVGEFFGTPKNFALYLCAARRQKEPCATDGAGPLFEARQGEPMRSLLRTGSDLMSLLEFLSPRLEYPLPPDATAAHGGEHADGMRFARLRVELAAAKALVEAAAGPPEDLAAARERVGQIEAEMAAIMKRYHDGSARAASWKTKSTIHINGGISLRPKEFTIRTTTVSPALKEFKQLARGAAVDAGSGGEGKRLVRSRPTASRPAAVATAKPAAPAKGAGAALPGAAAPGKPTAVRAPAGAPPAAEQGRSSKPAAPPAAAPKPATAKAAAAPAPPEPEVAAGPPKPLATVAKNVSVPAGAAAAGRVVGELAADGRIVFRKAAQ